MVIGHKPAIPCSKQPHPLYSASAPLLTCAARHGLHLAASKHAGQPKIRNLSPGSVRGKCIVERRCNFLMGTAMQPTA